MDGPVLSEGSSLPNSASWSWIGRTSLEPSEKLDIAYPAWRELTCNRHIDSQFYSGSLFHVSRDPPRACIARSALFAHHDSRACTDHICTRRFRIL